MAFTRPHSTSADATFSATGASAWNANQTPTGADVGGIPYCPTATTETTSANLTYTETSGPRLQVGTSGTSSGFIIGYGGSNNVARIWHSGLTPGSGNFALSQNSANDTVVNAQSGAFLGFAINGSNKAQISPTAGAGFAILAGTATTDVQALSATQTMNAAAVTFTGWKGTFTEGASGTAAGTSLIDLLYGTSGAESTQFKVRKDGLITTGGTACVASFGPAGVTSITVKNGLITAIS